MNELKRSDAEALEFVEIISKEVCVLDIFCSDMEGILRWLPDFICLWHKSVYISYKDRDYFVNTMNAELNKLTRFHQTQQGIC